MNFKHFFLQGKLSHYSQVCGESVQQIPTQTNPMLFKIIKSRRENGMRLYVFAMSMTAAELRLFLYIHFKDENL